MLDQFGETYAKSGEGSRKEKGREGGRTREMIWSRRCARSQAVPPEGETYDRCVTWMCRWSEGVPRGFQASRRCSSAGCANYKETRRKGKDAQ